LIQIATPISDLFHDSANANTICRLSDCLECRDRAVNSSFDRQRIFHSERQLIHPWDADLSYLWEIRKSKPELQLISFHAATCCTEPKIENGLGHISKSSEVLSEFQMLECVADNMAKIRSVWGDGVVIAVENNNYFPTPAYNIVTDPSFIAKVIAVGGLELLFDQAHAQITAHNTGIAYEEYLSALPLDKIVQIHICRPELLPGEIGKDSHEVPLDEDWECFKAMMSTAKNLKYVTIEYYRDVGLLKCALEQCRSIINGIS